MRAQLRADSPRAGALTAAVRSTSFRLLRMKQASPLSILRRPGQSAARATMPLSKMSGARSSSWRGVPSRPHLTCADDPASPWGACALHPH